MKTTHTHCPGLRYCTRTWQIIVIAALPLSVPVGVIAADTAPAFYESSFEAAEGFVAGEAPHGWSHDPNARISNVDGAIGDQAVIISASQEPALIARDVEIPVGTSEVFVDFHIRPAVAEDSALGSFVELGVSAVGFRRTPAGLDILAFDGRGADQGRWVVINTAAAMDQWIHVTIRHDYTRAQWDLGIDGEPARSGLGFFGAPTEGSLSLGVFGGVAGDTWIDAVSVRANPSPDAVQSSAPGSSASAAMLASMPIGSGVERFAARQTADSTSDRTRGHILPSHGGSSASLATSRDEKLKVKLVIYSVLE